MQPAKKGWRRNYQTLVATSEWPPLKVSALYVQLSRKAGLKATKHTTDQFARASPNRKLTSNVASVIKNSPRCFAEKFENKTLKNS